MHMTTTHWYTALHNRHEAIYKLTLNGPAVSKFACRGAGRSSGWGLLPGRAPLADPNAQPNEVCTSQSFYS
jgi:hypothetical protein